MIFWRATRMLLLEQMHGREAFIPREILQGEGRAFSGTLSRKGLKSAQWGCL